MKKLNTSIEAFIRKIHNLSTTVLWDRSFENAFIINSELINYTKDNKLVGPVFLINVENSILPIIQALHSIPKHHILVINNLSTKGDALLGDIIMTAARNQQIAGIVVIGKVRDVDSAPEIGVPLWACGTSINPAKLGAPIKEFPTHVTIGGDSLGQGDWLVGDGDGLIAISKEKIRLVIKSAEVKNRQENKYIEQLNKGNKISDLMNLENYLQGNGEIIVDF